MMISSSGSLSASSLRVNFEFMQIQATTRSSAASDEPVAAEPITPPGTSPETPVEDGGGRALDVAREAGRRAGMRAGDDDDRERGDRGAAPGSVREARRIGRENGLP